jgi:para-nitrobenzyl esterase
VALAQKLGLGADATAAQLRALPLEKLVGAVRARPVIDGRLMTEGSEQGFARGDQAPAPLIIGANSWEASLLPKAGYAAYAAGLSPAIRAAYPEDAGDPAKLAQDAFGDGIMVAPARWYAAQASRKAGAWLYQFSYVRVAKRGQIPGANHTSENPYVFDTQMIVPGYASEIVDADRAVAALMHACWVSFAKTGRPTCEAGGRAWPAYSPARDELMLFDDPTRIVAHFRKPQLDAQQAAQGSAIAP